MQKHLLLFISLCIGFSSIAQPNLDSLWGVWNDEPQSDTNRLKAMQNIAWDVYLFTQPDSAFYFAGLQYKFADSVGNKKWMSEALNIQGVSFGITGNYNLALEYFNKSIMIKNEIGDVKGKAASLGNIGIIYHNQGNIDKALEYYRNSIKIHKEIGYKRGIANTYGYLGNVCIDKGDYEQALLYYEESININTEIGSKWGLANSFDNIGEIYLNQKKYRKSMVYLNKSLKIRQILRDDNGMSSSYSSIGSLYYYQENYNKAITFGEKGLAMALKVGAVVKIKEASELLYDVYKKIKKSEKALQMYELSIQMRDSMLSEENHKELIRHEYRYEYEKKSLADSIFNVEQVKVKEAELQAHKAQIHEEKILRYGLVGGLALIFIFSFFLFNRFLVTRKQKNIIQDQKQEVDKAYTELETQKDKVESKNKEIMSSINYAKRIQRAILPEEDLIQNFFSEHFIFYHPKDIVGGDFYWYKCFGDKAVIATVDCTGHGVPGGFMSMMGSLLLDKIIKKDNLDTAAILSELNNEIIRVLKQNIKGEIQDGMDLALCIVDKKKRQLHFSGARNCIMLVAEKKTIRYNADLLPVGGSYSRKSKETVREYKSHVIPLKENTWVFMYSDGYYDQLGGDKKVSLGIHGFEDILKRTVINKQDKKKFLMKEFKLWKGEASQIDDMLVIGFMM